MRSLHIALLVAALASCKAKAGQHCVKQSDCAGDLVCDCADETEFACRDDAGATCMTHAQANAVCAANEVCRRYGQCEASPRAKLPPDQISPGCIATPAICAGPDQCARFGKCKLGDNECVAVSDDDCKRSEGCREYGSCGLDKGSCAPKSDADCVASTRCKTEGSCKIGEYGACDRPKVPSPAGSK